MTSPKSKRPLVSLAVLFTLALTACRASTPTPAEIPTPTPALPTATPVPMTAVVNGEGITVAEFEAELARFQTAQAALGNSVPLEEARQRVLDDLIDQTLLAQGAGESGFSLDEAGLQARIDHLAAQAGGPEALSAWQAAHGYTSESFRLALRRQVAAAWMRDRIISAIPSTAEQVHIQQILLYNSDKAAEVLAQLNAGADFDKQAAIYDRVTKGDLGWFPRGYLPEPKIENAAFALQPGQISGVVESAVGFHILKLIERDAGHLLSPDALLVLQNSALVEWLRQARAESTIILSP